MNIPVRLALMCAGLTLLPIPRSLAQSQSPSGTNVLSGADRKVALSASRIGIRGPRQARVWLQRQTSVRAVQTGTDGQTLDVHFRDGGELILVPRAMHRTAIQVHPTTMRTLLSTRDSTPGKAIVLEPFADELGLGSDAGQGEIAPLQAAGFSVDVLRNSQVTVASMENLSNYSVVYMETHSGTFGDGDAIILTRQTTSAGISDLFKDGSVTQGLAYGDQALYIAIKAQFVLKHMGKFPTSSVIFLNGCEVLGANVLWDAFRQQNVSTLISWDNKVINTLDEQAADFMFPRLAHGDTVATSIDEAKAVNLGVSTFENSEAHLGYLGDGSNTFSRALQGVLPPTATPTATTTALPTETATPLPTLTPPAIAIAFTFDKLATLNASGHPTQSFRSNSAVQVSARFTLHNAKNKVVTTIKRIYAYRRGGAWHTIGPAIVQHLHTARGSHVYTFTFVPQWYHTQRISIAITVAGNTKTRTASITVTR
jgi:hypothetical protein